MAIVGQFSFDVHPRGDVYLSTVRLDDPAIRVFQSLPSLSAHHAFRVSWVNADDDNDCGYIEGGSVPFKIGQVSESASALHYGMTYIFSLSVLTIGDAGTPSWQILTPRLKRRFDPAILAAPEMLHHDPAAPMSWLMPVVEETYI